MSATLQPLPEARRDITLDLLRGFALAGVLFMFCVSDIGTPADYTNSFWDEFIAWPKWILVESRMYTMLIIIFGIGFHVQMEKAAQKKASFAPVFMRRIAGLLIIGFIHATLLSTRDILMFYAVAGLALLPISKLSTRLILCILLVLFILMVTPLAFEINGNAWQRASSLVQPNQYTQHLQYNWEYFKWYHQVYMIYIAMLFHFLLGFWINKKRILEKLKTNTSFRKRVMFASLIASIVLIPVYYFVLPEVMPGFMQLLSADWQKMLATTAVQTLYYAWMLISVVLYATILTSISVSGRFKKWLYPLAAFGQMALSNYVMQSLILVPYFLAFDKFNNLPPAEGFLIYIPMLALQCWFSTWWMARFTLGPLEWLLRSVTYWEWQQIRRPAPARRRLQPTSLVYGD
jgi:uncharacterized protein